MLWKKLKFTEDGVLIAGQNAGLCISPNQPLMKIKVIHGEDELFNFVKTVSELASWAEDKKIFVAYFVVDMDRLPSFSECYSDYIIRPLYVGNNDKDDQIKIIDQVLNQIPNHVRVETLTHDNPKE